MGARGEIIKMAMETTDERALITNHRHSRKSLRLLSLVISWFPFQFKQGHKTVIPRPIPEFDPSPVRQISSVLVTLLRLDCHVVVCGPVHTVREKPTNEQSHRPSLCHRPAWLQAPVQTACSGRRMMTTHATVSIQAVPSYVMHQPSLPFNHPRGIAEAGSFASVAKACNS